MNQIKYKGIRILILTGLACLFRFVTYSGNVIIENDHFTYEIAPDGRNLHFIDKTTGVDYLYTDSVSYCASIIQNGKEFEVTSANLANNQLLLKFGNSGVTAEINIEKRRDRITMEITDVKGVVESLTFLNVPLKLEGMPYEPFAACVLSMNLFTHVRQLPALQTHLWASCYQRFGMKGAKATIIGVPQNDILPVIRQVMEQAEDIPHSDQGGAWAQLQKEGYGSYLMNFGTLTEETVPEWIAMCRSLGFNQIDSHGGEQDFFTFGDFELNPEKWPDGWDHFKRINERLHKAGISSILQTYAFFIQKKSKYARPVPSADLGYYNSFTIDEPVSTEDKEIVVKEPTDNIFKMPEFLTGSSITLRIGEELVRFSGVTSAPPYKFTGCTRGVNKTKISSHAPKDTVYYLKEEIGMFVPGAETPLFEEIARRTAEVVNECNFDGIYFDALDGDILDGAENTWYYTTKFIFKVAKYLKRPVSMEMCAMTHHLWHYRSRWQAWDRPFRGYKRFIDLHAAQIKTHTYQHGEYTGNTSAVEKWAKAGNGPLLLPLHLGWWGNQTWDPPQIEPTFPDDVEYLCCKMIGNNAGLSMLGGADKTTLDTTPLFRRLISIIKQYEELRHQNYFSDSIRAILREPGKEFTLFKEKNGQWNFKPIVYEKHKVTSLNDPTSHWTVQNKFASQPVRLRIEPLMSVKSYDDPGNMALAGFSGQEEFVNKEMANGVSGEISNSTEKSMDGKAAGVFSAHSSGASSREGSWICMEKKFEPCLNLEKSQALGVWINGDGNGELLNLRLESPEHISYGARGDHFIKIDFTGWKYFELVEIESSEFSNYIWPNSGQAHNHVYNSYRNTVKFNNIDKLQIWYNNLPAGKEVNCLVGTIKALPLVPVTIENPSVTIGGEKIVFPVRMESGMYIEFNYPNDCKLYGSKGELLREIVPEGKIPYLIPGENEISFSCDGPKDLDARVQVTVISEGTPLDIK